MELLAVLYAGTLVLLVLTLGYALLIDRSCTARVQKRAPTVLLTLSTFLFIALYALLLDGAHSTLRVPFYIVFYALLYGYSAIVLRHDIFNVAAIILAVALGGVLLLLLITRCCSAWLVLLVSTLLTLNAVHRYLCYCYEMTWYSFWTRASVVGVHAAYYIVLAVSPSLGYGLVSERLAQFLFLVHDWVLEFGVLLHLLFFPFEEYVREVYESNLHKRRYERIEPLALKFVSE